MQSVNGAQNKRFMHGELYVNALWTQDEERFIRSVSGVILTLYFVGDQ